MVTAAPNRLYLCGIAVSILRYEESKKLYHYNMSQEVPFYFTEPMSVGRNVSGKIGTICCGFIVFL